jgi:hypothetical protein
MNCIDGVEEEEEPETEAEELMLEFDEEEKLVDAASALADPFG